MLSYVYGRIVQMVLILYLTSHILHDKLAFILQNLTPSMSYNQVVILPTGLSREQKSTLQKCAHLLNGKVVEDFSTAGIYQLY